MMTRVIRQYSKEYSIYPICEHSILGAILMPKAMGHTDRSKVSYFGAGPAKLPLEVLKQAQDDLLNWQHTGVGILEVSHRSKQYMELNKLAESQLRVLLHVPAEYAVLFMQGGGTLQFAAVVYNLLRGDRSDKKVDYLVSGTWSSKAAEEATKLLGASRVNELRITRRPSQESNIIVIEPQEWTLSEEPAYVYFCDNETVDGMEMPFSEYIPDILRSKGINAPVVADMSSNFLSRPVDVSKFGLIFATAQKNFGPAGITVVIVRRSLIESLPTAFPIPTMMDYQIFDMHESLYNTPPCFATHVCSLVFGWIEKHFKGDLALLDKANQQKAGLLYNCIYSSEGFYQCPLPVSFRSRMNVVFRIHQSDGSLSEELETRFITMAGNSGLLQVAGHRSVGGIRVSLYNAVTMDDAMRMVEFMQQFYHSYNN